jgi:ParB-like chromosome segregation protein Spo0J
MARKQKGQARPIDVGLEDALMAATGADIEKMRLGKITLDKRLQMRVDGLNESHVQKLQASLQDGGEIKEPVVVVYDGERWYLADGYHRFEAHIREGRETIAARVIKGTFADAVVHAEEANIKHALGLDNQSKKNILFARIERDHKTTLETGEEISFYQLSNAAIGRLLGVNSATISRWIEEYTGLANARGVDRSTVYGLDGKAYQVEGIKEAVQERVERQREEKEEEERRSGAQPRGLFKDDKPAGYSRPLPPAPRRDGPGIVFTRREPPPEPKEETTVARGTDGGFLTPSPDVDEEGTVDNVPFTREDAVRILREGGLDHLVAFVQHDEHLKYPNADEAAQMVNEVYQQAMDELQAVNDVQVAAENVINDLLFFHQRLLNLGSFTETQRIEMLLAMRQVWEECNTFQAAFMQMDDEYKSELEAVLADLSE